MNLYIQEWDICMVEWHFVLCLVPGSRDNNSGSIIPRLFPPPVFDHLQYTKTEGGGLGERITFVTSGRREVGQCPTKNLKVLLVLFCPRTWDCNIKDSVNTVRCLVDLRLINAEFVSYNDRSPPPLASTLMSTWRHTCDSFSQVFPLRFCILQVIKNWRQEQPGNKAKQSSSGQKCNSIYDNDWKHQAQLFKFKLDTENLSVSVGAKF